MAEKDSPVTLSGNDQWILLVDDNRPYREAVKRNLEFIGYNVDEAEDMDSALLRLRRRRPILIITDLDMRTHTEGLDLIKAIKQQYSRIPVILISAVGTFDEGALARQMGALYVISKSRIDEEIENLYVCLDKVQSMLRRFRSLRERVEAYVLGDSRATKEMILGDLEQAIADTDFDAGLKSDCFDLINQLQASDREREIREELSKIRASSPTNVYTSVERELHQLLPALSELHEETRGMLRMAEIFKKLEENDPTMHFSRNVSFSYCFAVENEIKHRLGRKIARFVGNRQCRQTLNQLYDSSLSSLSLHFTQYLMIRNANKDEDLSIDIIRQVVERMCRHGERYKPDGLKALGVIFFCFGREYHFQTSEADIRVSNPLGLKGLEDAEVVQLSSSLIRLQHLRNPYIHPEFSEREKTDKLREVTLESLTLASRAN